MRTFSYLTLPTHLRNLLTQASFVSSDDSVPERGTTIPEYKARMKEGQKQIYYVSGASKAAASSSPVLDRLKSQGIEVYI